MKHEKVLQITQGAAIAAIYVVLTMFIAAFNLASGNIQVRISEALCILPVFTAAAVPGLWLGCFLANLLTGCAIWDVVFGSLATLLGAIGTYLLRRHKFLSTLPPVIANMVIVPFVLRYAYGMTYEFHGVNVSIPFFALTVGIGEVISVCILGTGLRHVLERYKDKLFKKNA